MGADRRIAAGGMEPRTSQRLPAPERRTLDQPRDDLPACLAEFEAGRHFAHAPAWSAQAMPQALWLLRQPGPVGREKNDRTTSQVRRAATADRPLGSRYHDGPEPGRKQRLRPYPGRTQERLCP